MSSGDYWHTTLAVARGVGMTPPQGQVIIIQTEAEMRPFGSTARASALKSDKLALNSRPKGPISRSVSFAKHERQCSSNEHQGLTFHMDTSQTAKLDASQALTAIAQVGLCSD